PERGHEPRSQVRQAAVQATKRSPEAERQLVIEERPAILGPELRSKDRVGAAREDDERQHRRHDEVSHQPAGTAISRGRGPEQGSAARGRAAAHRGDRAPPGSGGARQRVGWSRPVSPRRKRWRAAPRWPASRAPRYTAPARMDRAALMTREAEACWCGGHLEREIATFSPGADGPFRLLSCSWCGMAALVPPPSGAGLQPPDCLAHSRAGAPRVVGPPA